MQGAKSNTFYWLAVLYLVFSIFIFFLDSRGSLGFVHSSTQVLTIPVRSWLYHGRVALLSPLSVFSSAEQSQMRTRELEERVASLSSQLADQKALEEENAKMRRLLGTNLPPNWQFAPGRVVSMSGDVMNVVSNYSALAGTPVLAASESGILVGRVDKVVGRQTQVTLPTNISSKIPVIVRGQDGTRRASGIVVGQGGTVRLEQVLASESLETGDLILTSGDAPPAGGLPPELLVGYVDKVKRNEIAPWQEAGIKLPIKLEDLDFVFLITNSGF